MRSTENPEPATTIRSSKPRRHRRHGWARALGTLVVLLLILVVIAVWGLHRLGLTNSTLSGISRQLQGQSSKLSSVNARLQELLVTVQNGLQKLSQELTTLIRLARQHL